MNLHILFAQIATSITAAICIILSLTLSRPFFNQSFLLNLILGILLSTLIAISIVGINRLIKKFNLKFFNTLILGLFAGLFLSKAFTSIFDTLITSVSFGLDIPYYLLAIPKALLTILGIHLGVVVTFAYQEEFHISIPFVKFNKIMNSKKDIILDDSILTDPRALDFLSTGIVNGRLILPSFILRNLQEKLESSEEHAGAVIRRAIAIIEKLKSMKDLDIKENETDFLDITDIKKKVHRLAKITKSNILTAECSKLHSEPEDIKYINLSSIANSLKNVMTTGESIEIKVQRYGKEPKQGVGYLDDGTMVVINNGGNFIGEVIDTQVISVKQTSAGRIIFTNAMVEDEDENNEYAYEGHPTNEHDQ